jgi:hypothetical protein
MVSIVSSPCVVEVGPLGLPIGRLRTGLWSAVRGVWYDWPRVRGGVMTPLEYVELAERRGDVVRS